MPFSILQVGAKICCIPQPSEDKFKDCGADNIIQWQNITSTQLQIASCTELRFFPNNYMLTKSLEITAISDFIINGNGAMFLCDSSSLVISNSTGVKIMNITFTNCGCGVNNFVTPTNLFPPSTKAAIIFYNSFSMTIKNIVFENNPGFAIIGVNVMGESYYENITVSHYKSIYSMQETLQMTGGIILIYPQTNLTYKNTYVKVFIKHCDISNINSSAKVENKGENSVISLDHLSHAIGLIFHQPLYCIEAQMHGLTVTNITTVNGPLFLVSVHSTKLCALDLTLNYGKFLNNKIKLHPVVNCLLNTTCGLKYQTAFTILNSTFYRNSNATHILKMSNTANKLAMLVLEGRNVFWRNFIINSLFSVSGVIPVMKNYTMFIYNIANIIFSFSEYIKLDEGALIKIRSNKCNLNEKSFHRFIFKNR